MTQISQYIFQDSQTSMIFLMQLIRIGLLVILFNSFSQIKIIYRKNTDFHFTHLPAQRFRIFFPNILEFRGEIGIIFHALRHLKTQHQCQKSKNPGFEPYLLSWSTINSVGIKVCLLKPFTRNSI